MENMDIFKKGISLYRLRIDKKLFTLFFSNWTTVYMIIFAPFNLSPSSLAKSFDSFWIRQDTVDAISLQQF